MCQFEIKEKNNKAYIYTPYNADFVNGIKKRVGGAAWNRSDRCWIVDAENVEQVRALMRDVYGRDDKPVEMVTIRVTTKREMYEECGAVTLFGKQIARAFGRDSGAKPCDNIVFFEKYPTSGGSRNRWKTIIPEGAVFVVSGIPKTLWKQFTGSEDFDAKIEEVKGHKLHDLIREKKELLQRLTEIEKQLAELKA